MKKLFAVLFMVSLLASCASALEVREAMLSLLNMTQEEFSKSYYDKSYYDDDLMMPYYRPVTLTSYGTNDVHYVPVFYDSMTAMLMALEAGEVDSISVPAFVAHYVMRVNKNYIITEVTFEMPASLVLGFKKDDDPTLRNKINEALRSMKADWTLAVIKAKYIDEAGATEPEVVKFEHFDGAETIKVAVTGDVPPIDYVAADGRAAGFNTAVLAEIGRRIHANIELVNIDAGARAAALASGRVDAVFWFYHFADLTKQTDVPESIAVSEPYYTVNEYINFAKK